IRRALVLKALMRLVCNVLTKNLGDTALSDARLTAQEHNLAFPVLGDLPAPHEKRDLCFSPNERRQMDSMRRFETSLGMRQATHFPCPNRIDYAFQRLRADVLELECAADQPPRRRADDDLVRARETLDPFRQVRCLAQSQFRN